MGKDKKKDKKDKKAKKRHEREQGHKSSAKKAKAAVRVCKKCSGITPAAVAAVVGKGGVEKGCIGICSKKRRDEFKGKACVKVGKVYLARDTAEELAAALAVLAH